MYPCVVKFGGSLLDSRNLEALLEVAGDRGAVVAPGGGAFADAVRVAQREIGFSDRAAHAMAILAMEQTALLLADLAPSFALCATSEEFTGAFAARRPAIWRPAAMALRADVPASWDTTSDSLSLWLAMKIEAPRLVILKSAEVQPGGSPDSWSAAGLVDAGLPTLALGYRGEIACVGPAEPAVLAAALAAPSRIAA